MRRIEGDINNDDEVYATYTSGEQEIFLTVGISDDVRGAQEGVKTATSRLTAFSFYGSGNANLCAPGDAGFS